jgi:hypothetical protein
MQHLDGSGAWPSYVEDARFLKVNILYLLRVIIFPRQSFGVLCFTNRLISTANFTIGTTACLSPRKNAMCMPPQWEQRALWRSHFTELGFAKPCPEIQNTQGLYEINVTKYRITTQYFMHFVASGTEETTQQKRP